jgi:hypothetical protein
MIEVGAGIAIGPGIVVGQRPVPGIIIDFVEEDGTTLLIAENGDQFIEENT